MVKFKIERISECLTDMHELHIMHWEEICTNTEVKVLNPDYNKYAVLEDNDMLRIYVARDDGKLIGYFISFIGPHTHYQECITALNDILFIHPDYRGGTTGYRLIRGAIQDLKDNTKANILIIHMKIKHPFRTLLRKLGFEQTEEMWEVGL